MARGVAQAICSFVTESNHLEDVERMRNAKQDAMKFLQTINEDESRLEQFNSFGTKLLTALVYAACCSSDTPCRSEDVKREKLWSAFHKLRVGAVDAMWRCLFEQDGFSRLSPLVYQHVTEKLFGGLIKDHFKDKLETSDVDIPPLTTDEENIIRYAAGYVPFKLLKKYEKMIISSSSQVDTVGIIECLSTMAVNGEESDMLEYTAKWTRLVNRGGLFEVNDTAFMLFKEIEVQVRKHLFIALQRCTVVDGGQREVIVSAVASDNTIRRYWTTLSVDIESEEQALREAIGLWLTIRGFAIAGTWLEQYLQVSKGSSKKKGLRKELKKKSSASSKK